MRLKPVVAPPADPRRSQTAAASARWQESHTRRCAAAVALCLHRLPHHQRRCHRCCHHRRRHHCRGCHQKRIPGRTRHADTNNRRANTRLGRSNRLLTAALVKRCRSHSRTPSTRRATAKAVEPQLGVPPAGVLPALLPAHLLTSSSCERNAVGSSIKGPRHLLQMKPLDAAPPPPATERLRPAARCDHPAVQPCSTAYSVITEIRALMRYRAIYA